MGRTAPQDRECANYLYTHYCVRSMCSAISDCSETPVVIVLSAKGFHFLLLLVTATYNLVMALEAISVSGATPPTSWQGFCNEHYPAGQFASCFHTPD